MLGALHTDLYQLTMMLGYLKHEKADMPVTCEAFVRRLPAHRSFLLVSGLALIVDYLRSLHFTAAQLDYLRTLPPFKSLLDEPTYERILGFRFTGNLWAMPEGTVAFANEPLLRIEAPLWQAQLVETALLSILNHSTLISSKAARIVAAAKTAGVMEFGTRRTHGEAAVNAARAAYIGGCSGSSNVEAGYRYGIPVYGTMAHMWIMSHPNELQAFIHYLKSYPEHATLLVDTYDILAGTRNACAAAWHHGHPQRLFALRIDSHLFDAQTGRPSGICRQVRQLLDELGFQHTRILVSDDLNEKRITDLFNAGEPIDSLGVGTELVTSKDAPAIGGVYKIVWVGGKDGHPVAKLSPGKATYPGVHQVYRQLSSEGKILRDVLALSDETLPLEPLLEPILAQGEILPRMNNLHDLAAIRARAASQLALLPPETLLGDHSFLQVEPSRNLQALSKKIEEQLLNEVKAIKQRPSS
jgi:nicotinate phosphoribosyltransferase